MRFDATARTEPRCHRADVHLKRRTELRLVVIGVGDERALQSLVGEEPVERKRDGDGGNAELPPLEAQNVVLALCESLCDFVDKVTLRAEPAQRRAVLFL